jgi:epoxyqueuosine reductase
MTKQEATALFKSELIKSGFTDFRIHNVSDLNSEKESYLNWLRNGMHGRMQYLEKNLVKRFRPFTIMDGTKTIISVLLNYYPHQKQAIKNNYRIAKYAYGNDYHFVIKYKLSKVADKIKRLYKSFNYRAFTDSAPLMDRYLAQKSGLGWIGKNTLLINKKWGSFCFIGHLFLDIQLELDDLKIQEDLCMNCDKCLKACPTKALYSPYKMNATKCISYQTIENKSPQKDEEAKKFRNFIFGCDICQDVCPFNRNLAPHGINEFEPLSGLFDLSKDDWTNLSKQEFGEMFRGSAVKRAGYKGLKQNINWLKTSK